MVPNISDCAGLMIVSESSVSVFIVTIITSYDIRKYLTIF